MPSLNIFLMTLSIVVFSFSNGFASEQLIKNNDLSHIQINRQKQTLENPGIIGMDHFLTGVYIFNSTDCDAISGAFDSLLYEAGDDGLTHSGGSGCKPYATGQSLVEWEFYLHPSDAAGLASLKTYLTKHQDEVFFGQTIHFKRVRLFAITPFVSLCTESECGYRSDSLQEPLYFDSMEKLFGYVSTQIGPLFKAPTPDAFYNYAEKWFDNSVITNIKFFMNKSRHVSFSFFPMLIFDDGTVTRKIGFGPSTGRECNNTCW
jgi:hypothetical protein